MTGRAQAVAEPPPTVREGNRWIGDPPSSEDVAEWFVKSVKLHDDLEHGHYIGGITLISGTEKQRRMAANGTITRVDRLVHTPYPRVDARLNYFYDWCRINGYLGEIVPVRVRNGVPELPHEGFFKYNVVKGGTSSGRNVPFVGCAMQAFAYKPDLRAGGKGNVVLQSPPASKIVPVYDTDDDPDPYAPMKAETGAIGRCLAMAGMLVIPGSGVATAEDILDMARAGSVGAAEEPALPAEGPETGRVPEDPREYMDHLRMRLESEDPAKADELAAWATEKEIDLAAVKPAQIRPLTRKMEQLLG